MARASTAAARLATSTLAAPPGRSAPASAATTAGRVVDDLEHGVAEHQVGAARRDQPGERVGVALHGADPARRRPASAARRVSAASASGLASTTVTGGPASASGTANPPVPPPTSTHGQLTAGLAVQLAAQHRPDHGGAGAGRRAGDAGMCALHACETRARGRDDQAGAGSDAARGHYRVVRYARMIVCSTVFPAVSRAVARSET